MSPRDIESLRLVHLAEMGLQHTLLAQHDVKTIGYGFLMLLPGGRMVRLDPERVKLEDVNGSLDREGRDAPHQEGDERQV